MHLNTSKLPLRFLSLCLFTYIRPLFIFFNSPTVKVVLVYVIIKYSSKAVQLYREKTTGLSSALLFNGLMGEMGLTDDHEMGCSPEQETEKPTKKLRSVTYPLRQMNILFYDLDRPAQSDCGHCPCLWHRLVLCSN